MNIVILAGGTGSIALQTGLYDYLKEIDGIDIKVLVNAYDNGLSTGSVRQVLDGHILGPSDVRKNQTTRLKLENPSSPWNNFLDIRFTQESSVVKNFCLSCVDDLDKKIQEHSELSVSSSRKNYQAVLVREAIEEYFKAPNALKIDYVDFSLANIVYAGFAKANGNSLRRAATIMAKLMGIKDNVLLNDDTSLFLGAVSASGVRISDEGDIVSWGDVNDPFVDVFFTDAAGNDSKPVLCEEARLALESADLIILSSGTQWSSLIPTYETLGFRDAVLRSQAKVLMMMNRQPDKDCPGQTASDIIRILVPRYFEDGTLNVILDITGHKSMSSLDATATNKVASVSTYSLGFPVEDKKSIFKHSPSRLGPAIARTYFREFIHSKHFMFDYDDTLVGRGNSQPQASALNRKMLAALNGHTSVSICTGNGIKGIALRSTPERNFEDNDILYKPLIVFADGGVNQYEYDMRAIGHGTDADDTVKSKYIGCIDHRCLIPKDGIFGSNNIIDALKDFGIPLSKIENRGNVIISIKPIDVEYRPIVLSLVQFVVKGTGLYATVAGRTTIDISHPLVSKVAAVNHVLNSTQDTITYVGDEFTNGNDTPVLQMNNSRVKCLHVKNPAHTAFFIKTVLRTVFTKTALNKF